jgi:two-component system, sensor histidine kinase YesM
MILITIFILIFIVVLVEAFIYIIDIPIQMKNAKEYDLREVQNISDRLDTAITNYDWFLNTITMDEKLQEELNRDYKNSKQEHLLNYELQQTLNSISLLSSDKFENIFLYDKNKLRTSILNSYDYDRSLLLLNKHAFNTTGNVQWQVDNGKIYIHRAIYGRNSLKLIGFITISIKKDYLDEVIRTASSNRFIFIYNEFDKLVYHNQSEGNSSIPIHEVSKLSSNLNRVDSNNVVIQPYGEMLLTTHQSRYSLWKIVSLIPLSQITEGPHTLAKWIIIIGITGIILGTLIIWISSNRLIQPLKELKIMMSNVEQNNYNVKVFINRNDEFGALGRSFNNMMSKINHLISEVYQNELSRKEAEYKALKAQINPHFLYNTLETIRNLAEFGENQKIEKVVVALSRLLKGSISNTKDFITVREEMDYIKAYLAIQNTRFQDKVDVLIDVDSEILERKIPRFILQPLIENAFIHGMERKIGRGNLIIKGYSYKEATKFEIIDDGVGMDQHQLDHLFSVQQRVNDQDRKGTGHGMYNVNERLKILFGDSYSLIVNSAINMGTIIKIHIPLEW